MKHTERIDKDLLKRYLEGTGSYKDRSTILSWINNPELNSKVYEESYSFWSTTAENQHFEDYNEEDLLQGIHRDIKFNQEVYLNELKPKTNYIGIITKVAAILLFPLIISTLLLLFQNKSFKNSISWVEIQSPVGTKTNFLLPDGSSGYLNGGSLLKFPTHFSGKTRNISLSGEAYFNVKSNLRKPLIVSAKKIEVKVVGTSFNVMAYSDEPKVEVTLVDGIVEIYERMDGKNKFLEELESNESFTFNEQSSFGVISTTNVSEKLSWVEGKLKFKYEKFDDVIRKINRWYNVNIQIMDESLNSHIYYGTFENETLEEVLNLLQYTAPIKFKEFQRVKKSDGSFEKRKIEIYKK